SIELTSPALAHLNVLASANEAIESPAQSSVASATERRSEIVIRKPPICGAHGKAIVTAYLGREIALP
ncbi:MAG TPA: hypothetical protein VEC14_14570, partial [Reyranellaceae bacterium]|nr:hypothetical protein [Reyranellaceae bacterium]